MKKKPSGHPGQVDFPEWQATFLAHLAINMYFINQCYYIGGTEDAATGMLNEVIKPLSYHKPAEKICEDLKKRDGQICELQYGKCK